MSVEFKNVSRELHHNAYEVAHAVGHFLMAEGYSEAEAFTIGTKAAHYGVMLAGLAIPEVGTAIESTEESALKASLDRLEVDHNIAQAIEVRHGARG